MKKTGIRLGFAAIAVAAAAAVSGAAEITAAERSASGRTLAAEGDCEQALPLLESAYREDPSDVAAALADVQCRIQQRRYAEARDLLAMLRERAPQSAEVHLYSGIVAFEARDHQAAVRAFERAREIDAARVDPIASYYAGLSRARLGDRAGAVADLGRARDMQPGGAWADRASKALARIERSDARRPWRLELTSGIESDDNVVLRGEDIALPEDISDEGDERLMWRVKGSSELLRGGAGALSVSGDYSGSAHLELEEFDVHYPSAALWWQRSVGERSATRVEYRIGHAWVDGDAFVTSHSLGPTLVHTWQSAGRSTFRARGFGFSYRDEPSDVPDGSGAPGDPCPATTPAGSACGTPGVDESRRRDRTGIGYELFAGHKWDLPWWERAIELRPGFRFQQYLARGSESSHLRLEPDLGARIALPFALFANTDVSYAYRPYQGSASLPAPGTAQSGVQFQALGKTRRDQVTRVGVGLERELFGSVIAELRYSFVDQNSNLAVADYQRHIFGGYVTVRLGR